MTKHKIYQGDCLDVLARMDDNSVDLVLTSPPYEAARKYAELGFDLQGEDWVEWAFDRYIECVRVSRGLVCWVVEGRTKNFRWSATPALLMADLHRAGIKLRKPPVYQRFGIPGSGGPDWLRNDWEFCVCASKGKLPWSDPTILGHPPKFPPGGNLSSRSTDGTRCDKQYKPPKRANPGNIINIGAVGGGNIGNKLAHDNEAPFPEKLAEFFIRSFCPPGGIVLDVFSGSNTTGSVAAANGRNSIGVDIRESQVSLGLRRLEETLESTT